MVSRWVGSKRLAQCTVAHLRLTVSAQLSSTRLSSTKAGNSSSPSLSSNASKSDMNDLFKALLDTSKQPTASKDRKRQAKSMQTAGSWQRKTPDLAPSSPLEHTDVEQSNKFYLLKGNDKELMKTHVLPAARIKECEEQGFYGVMVRKQAQAVLRALSLWEGGESNPRFTLTGPDGSGKTMSLAHITHFALSKGWIVFHLPSASELVLEPPVVEPSVDKPDEFDHTWTAQMWLTRTMELNPSLFDKLTLETEQTWIPANPLTTDAGTPFKELLPLIQEDDRTASQLLPLVISHTLKLKERAPVLFVVDDVNALFTDESRVRDANNKIISPSKMTMVQMLRSIYEGQGQIPNTAMVGATGFANGALANSEPTELTQKATDVVTLEGDEDIQAALSASSTPSFTAEYGRLTTSELRAILNYYESIGWCAKTGLESDSAQLHLMLGDQFGRIGKYLESL
eukprot:m.48514 g.48514  ORF g.48514 m.48514 type:complete len:456 (-) comp11046_c0_seq1:1207-2574(-)